MTLTEAMNKVQMEKPATMEYRIMYLFGSWITAKVIYAETDKEAMHDFEEYMQGRNTGLEYALWMGNRRLTL